MVPLLPLPVFIVVVAAAHENWWAGINKPTRGLWAKTNYPTLTGSGKKVLCFLWLSFFLIIFGFLHFLIFLYLYLDHNENYWNFQQLCYPIKSLLLSLLWYFLKNYSVFILSPIVDLHITVCVCHDTNLVFLACSLMYQRLLPWNRSWTFPFLPGIFGQSIAT